MRGDSTCSHIDNAERFMAILENKFVRTTKFARKTRKNNPEKTQVEEMDADEEDCDKFYDAWAEDNQNYVIDVDKIAKDNIKPSNFLADDMQCFAFKEWKKS